MAVPRKYPPIETLDRLRHWCASQERAHSDVRRKLASWGVYGDEVEQLLTELISEGYLNEARFARAFAEGKYRIKRWGWNKIEAGLRQKGISAFSMQEAKAAYEAHDHADTLQQLLLKKRDSIHEADPFKRKAKLMRFALSKGYSYAQVRAAFDALAGYTAG